MNLRIKTKKANFWLGVAVISGALGFCIGLFSLMLVGVGVSGSGCGSQCSSSSEFAAAVGMFLLGISAPSAVYSVLLTWVQSGPASRLSSDIMVTIVGFLVALMAGSSLVLLRGI